MQFTAIHCVHLGWCVQKSRNANGISVVQGGSGYPYFAPSTFSYISGVDTCSIVATRDEIPDPEVEEALQKVINMAAVWCDNKCSICFRSHLGEMMTNSYRM